MVALSILLVISPKSPFDVNETWCSIELVEVAFAVVFLEGDTSCGFCSERMLECCYPAGSIPTELAQMQALTRLYLCENSLTGRVARGCVVASACQMTKVPVRRQRDLVCD